MDRVLLVAEMASPERVSVALEGWCHSRSLSRLVDSHLVTQVRNRDAFLRAGLEEGRDFTAIDNEWISRPVARMSRLFRGGMGKGWTTVMAMKSLPYYAFERQVWHHFGQRIRDREFGIVHRITPLSPTMPSSLAQRCAKVGVPFVLGPLNGGVPWPSGFDSARRREREWLSYVRGAYKLLPGYRSTRKHAASIIIGSQDTWKQLPARYRDKAVYIPENAIEPERFSKCVDGPVSTPLRVVFVGRLVPYKGADMLIEAAAPLMREGLLEIDIIGDGPERERLNELVQEEGVGAAVTFPGWIEHEDLQDRLIQSDLLGFPSIREFGGGVVLEAMALGLVPIVLDYGGPGELVTTETGFALPMATRDEIVASLRRTFMQLVDDTSVIRPMGRRARDRVLSNFTWDAKARQVLEVYRWVTQERTTKPNFGMPLADSALTPLQENHQLQPSNFKYRRSS